MTKRPPFATPCATASPMSSSFLQAHAVAAERFRERDEIEGRLPCGERRLESLRTQLVHLGAEAVVVPDDQHHLLIVAADRVELLKVHHQAAVAFDDDVRAAWIARRRCRRPQAASGRRRRTGARTACRHRRAAARCIATKPRKCPPPQVTSALRGSDAPMCCSKLARIEPVGRPSRTARRRCRAPSRIASVR